MYKTHARILNLRKDMRLSELEHRTLKQAALDSFGADAAIHLFGSRTDDSRKGGDIDLLIETGIADVAQLARAHTRFLARVYTVLGEQKIDVLIDYPGRLEGMPIYDLARANGVML